MQTNPEALCAAPVKPLYKIPGPHAPVGAAKIPARQQADVLAIQSWLSQTARGMSFFHLLSESGTPKSEGRASPAQINLA